MENCEVALESQQRISDLSTKVSSQQKELRDIHARVLRLEQFIIDLRKVTEEYA